MAGGLSSSLFLLFLSSFRYRLESNSGAVGKDGHKEAVLPIYILKYYEVSVHLTHQWKHWNPLSSQYFSAATPVCLPPSSIALASSLHSQWATNSFPDNAVLFFQTRSFSSSAHTNPSRFHKSLIFHSSRKIFLDPSVWLKYFFVSRFSSTPCSNVHPII